MAEQKIFFVATATADSKINMSPKGMDSLRVIDKNRIAWLNVSGSGNETAAHVQISPRMTLMFCAFEGDPLILRLYGSAKVIHQTDPEWDSLFFLFEPIPGVRQIFDVSVDFVQTSCGWAVSILSYVEERTILSDWAKTKNSDDWKAYWALKNQKSIDGITTNILEKNFGSIR
ncbi:pyridoxamine 5'-phosphate oxidase family protein [Actimicrobium sp. CCC2.4]|nr:pyridoxamine 5'-phosphate oxidase family protein [Actimicrobium sp. CCC2.4]